MKSEILTIAETFHSLQGEGPTAGVPAIFLRLSFCGFCCTFCDTLEVWKKGTKLDHLQLKELFEAAHYLDKLNRGDHLVVTGGDPLIQQEALASWLAYMERKTGRVHSWFIELETQGALMPSTDLRSWVWQWNVSPKLANSGMPLERRTKPEVLRWHASTNSIFKFPIALKSDIDEVVELVEQFDLPWNKVFLMPVCASREGLITQSAMVAELCTQYGFNYSPRLQLLIWDKSCGC
jgi:6-pyruvoyltetrahydropterin 2'-reductase